MDGCNKNLLDELLTHKTGLDFPRPKNYSIWRNYGRSFRLLGLASIIGNQLKITEICERLVTDKPDFLSNDEYLHFFIRKFYHPSPALSEKKYESNLSEKQSFPFCAVLKRLLAKIDYGEPFITVDEVFGYLIGNDVTGLESLAFYKKLADTGYKAINAKQFSNDADRQVRESLIFLSQLTYLSWFDKKLFIDPETISHINKNDLIDFYTPIVTERSPNREIEIQNMWQETTRKNKTLDFKEVENLVDTQFIEGKKIRVNHLKTERNRKVIKHYFDSKIQNHENPFLCDMCNAEMKYRYPWIDNLIEVHHILPLSSTLHIDKKGTSLKDLVGLCPNCHRATHAFYRSFLLENNLDDFQSEEEAREVYAMVKEEFVSK